MVEQTRIDELRHRVIEPQKLFINGTWQSGSGETLDVISPINGQIITTLERANENDVSRAVAAARAAFDDGRWSRAAPSYRKSVLHRLADLIEKHALELAVLGVRDNGTELNMALKAEPGSAAGTFRYYAEALDKVYGEIAPTDHGTLGLVHREPVGVVAAIVPWNFPLMIGSWKLAPALAMGDSVVLKPAETASLSLLKLAELAAQAGLPDGVLNVVTGQGSVAGQALGLSMDVDVMVFTGSGPVGRRLLEYSAKSNLKRTYLELGGKSPNIVFADAPNLDEAAKVSAMGIFRNSGQVCVAGSRLLVERPIHDDFVAKVAHYASHLRVGDPLELSTDIGAVNSLTQLNGNLGFVEKAREQGSTVYMGGNRALAETGGYYMEPTIITDVKPDHNLAQNEVFGPVLGVMPFDTDDQAVQIANSTPYGLASGVWTSNLSRAHQMVRRIQAGVVHVNTYGGADNTVPLGGVKQSGNGHDKSMHAMDKYVDLKTAWFKI